MSIRAARMGAAGTGTSKWYGGCLSSNGGFAIFTPRTSGQGVLKLDLSDGSWTTFAATGGNQNGAALGGNGYVYSCGGSGGSSPCLKIDVNAETTSTVGSNQTSNNFRDAVAGSNGDVYLIPSNATVVRKIDTGTDTLSDFGSVGSGTNKWYSGVLVGDDIYCPPMSATTVLKIDTAGDTASTFGSLGSSTNKWWGCVLVGTDIYCAPYESTSALKIDTTSDTTSTFGTFASGAKFTGACYIGGYVVFTATHSGANRCVFIDPATDEIRYDLAETGTTDSRWLHHPVVSNDIAWLAPYDDTDVLRLSEIGDWGIGAIRIK